MYGKAYHLPIKLKQKAYWARKSMNPDIHPASRKRKLQLQELEEWCLTAYKNLELYKERTIKYHDKNLK